MYKTLEEVQKTERQQKTICYLVTIVGVGIVLVMFSWVNLFISLVGGYLGCRFISNESNPDNINRYWG